MCVNIFVTAMLLTFVLNYPVQLLQHLKMPRTRTVLYVLLRLVCIVAGEIALLGILGVTVVPTLIEQANELANRLPTWINSGSPPPSRTSIAPSQHSCQLMILSVNLKSLF
jgi:predicted PurR-regulated permease PerM